MYILWIAVAACVALLVSFSLQRRGGSLQGKRLFITGCDSGFGRLMALKYCEEGAHVFAACLTQEGATGLEDAAIGKGRITTILMDVTNPQQVQDAFEVVKTQIEKLGTSLYALINNAGMIAGWYVEMTDMAVYQRVMEVNFFGCVRVTKTFLPMIQDPGGRVITITSCSTLLAGGGMSAYACSKWAQNAFLDALRRELVDSGIKVVKIVPGFFRTPMLTHGQPTSTNAQLYETAPQDIQRRYQPKRVRTHIQYSASINKFAGNPSAVVESVRCSLLSKHPPTRILVGYDAHLLWWPLSLIPEGHFDFLTTLSPSFREWKR